MKIIAIATVLAASAAVATAMQSKAAFESENLLLSSKSKIRASEQNAFVAVGFAPKSNIKNNAMTDEIRAMLKYAEGNDQNAYEATISLWKYYNAIENNDAKVEFREVIDKILSDHLNKVHDWIDSETQTFNINSIKAMDEAFEIAFKAQSYSDQVSIIHNILSYVGKAKDRRNHYIEIIKKYLNGAVDLKDVQFVLENIHNPVSNDTYKSVDECKNAIERFWQIAMNAQDPIILYAIDEVMSGFKYFLTEKTARPNINIQEQKNWKDLRNSVSEVANFVLFYRPILFFKNVAKLATDNSKHDLLQENIGAHFKQVLDDMRNAISVCGTQQYDKINKMMKNMTDNKTIKVANNNISIIQKCKSEINMFAVKKFDLISRQVWINHDELRSCVTYFNSKPDINDSKIEEVSNTFAKLIQAIDHYENVSDSFYRFTSDGSVERRPWVDETMISTGKQTANRYCVKLATVWTSRVLYDVNNLVEEKLMDKIRVYFRMLDGLKSYAVNPTTKYRMLSFGLANTEDEYTKFRDTFKNFKSNDLKQLQQYVKGLDNKAKTAKIFDNEIYIPNHPQLSVKMQQNFQFAMAKKFINEFR